MLDIQKYISNFRTVSDANVFLSRRFKLRVRAQNISPHNGSRETVYIYNSTMTSPPSKITSEANGLILNKHNEIVSASFRNFYEFDHESMYDLDSKSNIDISTARIEKFYDGDLVVVYTYKGTLLVNTSHRVAGDDIVSMDHIDTFNGFAKSILYSNIGPTYSDMFEPHKCYAFELISPSTEYITIYDESELILLAIFDKNLCEELPKWELDRFARLESHAVKIARPKFAFINNIYGIKNNMNDLQPLDRGFVIVDQNGNRAKYTAELYRALDYIKDGIDLNAIDFATVILAGFYPILRSINSSFDPVYGRLQSFMENTVAMLNSRWGRLSKEDSIDDFVYKISKMDLHADLEFILLALRRKIITNASEGMRYIKPKTLVYLICKYDKGFQGECRECGIDVDPNLRLNDVTELQRMLEGSKNVAETSRNC